MNTSYKRKAVRADAASVQTAVVSGACEHIGCVSVGMYTDKDFAVGTKSGKAICEKAGSDSEYFP